MINDKEFESFVDQVDADCGNYCISPQEALNMWRDSVELRLRSNVEQRADNTGSPKLPKKLLKSFLEETAVYRDVTHLPSFRAGAQLYHDFLVRQLRASS